MKHTRLRASILVAMLTAAGLLVLGPSAPAPARAASAPEKLKAEEVVLKHLHAVGADESRSSVKSVIVIGNCKFSFRSRGVGHSEGRVVIASDGPKSLIGMEFPEREYPYERIGFDGRNFSTSYIRPGVRTVLGDFLYTHSELFREGLIGGTLTQAWPLFDLAARGAKIEYDGTQKVNGRDAHVLNYHPRKGTDFEIKLFFDAETFQHVRSEYQHVIAALQGSTDKNSASQRPSTYKIVEEFSDYKKESGLTLPHAYRLQFVADDAAGTKQLDWAMSFERYSFNSRIPPESFNVETYKPGE